MKEKGLRISVVICTKDRVPQVIKCAGSVLGQTVPCDELIIVDSSDTDRLNLEVGRFNSSKSRCKIKYIHSDIKGLTYQRNLGVRHSFGDIVLFLDDDVVLEKDFMEQVLKVFEEDKEGDIAGVGGDIINIAGRNRSVVQFIGDRIYAFLASLFFLYKPGSGKFQPSGFPTYPYGSNKLRKVECLPGGLTAYRRKVLNEFTFDENLSGYSFMEDDDFSYRVSRKYRNVYTPHAKVSHYPEKISGDERYARTKMLIEHHYYLFRKNLPQDPVHKLAFWWSVVGLFVVRIIARDNEGLRGLKEGIISIKRRAKLGRCKQD